MSDVILQLPIDRTGRNPNNLVGSEEHTLVAVAGFPYKIITMEHGGFYVKSLRVYDVNYNKLIANQDYIVTYVYKTASDDLGMEICGAIVFLDKTRTGKVYCSAQMVGGDLCYSFTVIEDYIAFWKTKPATYIPTWMDYAGNEPVWKPGELEKERWHLDTYQQFNNEIERLALTVEGGTGVEEDDYRNKVETDYLAFLAKFNDRLDRHIADKANPHVDTKASVLIDLGRVANYPVATEAQAIAGTSNALYTTPYLTSKALDEWALKPLRAHIDNKANPHAVTVTQTEAVTKVQVANMLDSKYGINETVANTNNAFYNNRLYNYDQLFEDYRFNLLATNFTYGGAAGYIHPSRIGRGAPTAAKVLMSDGMWTDFNALTEIYITEASPTCIVFNSYQNFGVATSTPEALAATTGSLLFYMYRYETRWGSGNGSSRIAWDNVQVCYKTAAGWIAM